MEGNCNGWIGLSGFVHARDVGVDHIHTKAPRPRCFGHPEIVSYGDTPGYVYDLRGSFEESLREVCGSLRESGFQLHCFEGSDRHALAVDRVEAADGVTHYEVALRKSFD